MHHFTVFTAFSLLPFTWAAPTSACETSTVGQTVDTSSGPIAGHPATTAGYSEVSEYLGIPFGQSLRFAAPVKFTGSSLINGSEFGPSCPFLPSSSGTAPTPEAIAFSNVTAVGLQLFGQTVGSPSGARVSEDCLSLNVWSKPQVGEQQKAVMVFIHGGAFSGGTSAISLLNGAALAEKEDVVFVTLNYRVNILGFPGDPNVERNVAFLDQRLALEWVRDNIANFGGDPGRITLFGQSAGAASSDYLSYAYPSDPIAAGIISQSGTAFSFELPYTVDQAAAVWYRVSEAVGCGNATSSTNSTTMACMRNVDLTTLLAAVPQEGVYSLFSAFGPTVDDTIVFSNYSERTPASIPVLVGSNDYEGGLGRTQLALGGVTIPDADWDIYNLAAFTCPAGTRASASLAASNPTWRYRFHGVWPNINISSQGGAYHGAELQLLFGTTFPSPPSATDEDAFQTYIQGAWGAFAKDPVHGLTAYEWPEYNPAEETLVRLAYENRVGTNLGFPGAYDEGCGTASLSELLCRLLGACNL